MAVTARRRDDAAMRVRRVRTVGLLGALALAVVIGVSGCFGPSASASGPAGAAKFYHQKLTWKPCVGAYICTKVTVPEDWSKPGGATIHVGLIKSAALSGRAKGTIIWNPGGPGGVAEDYTGGTSYGVDGLVAADYDVVGYDPPGVGLSTRVDCGPESELGTLIFAPDPAPVGSAAWVSAEEKSDRSYAAECVKHTGTELLRHVDTVTAARDLDVVRAALGQKRLDYVGESYGTDLGIVYESLFPEHIGRVVLDGVEDPLEPAVDLDVNAAAAFEKDLDDYLASCSGRLGCPFTGSLDQSRATLANLLAGLADHPLTTSGSFRLGGGAATLGISDGLASQSLTGTAFSNLDDALTAAMHGNGDDLLTLAEDYFAWSPDFTSGSWYPANIAISCADRSLPTGAAAMADEAMKLRTAAPVLGPYFSYQGAVCEGLPTSGKHFSDKTLPRPAHPVLIVSATGDPETPHSNAVAVHARMSNTRLLIRDGDGHTSYNGGNNCVDSAVDAYLMSGTLPQDNTHC
ncbi:alpha/beta hydrolase [Gryllotalpicola protaetiae]|uniref:Alpha/beta hydrolase n=1 Tax=Gryllotalpicola protaetiae TaxID=2419771 RepID=A0A387C2C8_9MICO|nr:alpha/beta hydrolase [Gryllotalpicola protaetiae]AYG04681.1 alpha/beta hydrolase [Gryllotalpicola protaetiae]